MAMGTYDAQARSALAIIKRKGVKITLHRKVSASFDPVTQVRTTPAEVTGDFYVVVLPPGRSAEFRIGELVKRNVVQLYMARWGTTMVPDLGDTFVVGGHTYTLLAPVTHYDPADDGAVLTVAYGER